MIYNAQGRIFRLELNSDTKEFGRITGEMVTDLEPPRILAVPSNEDVLLLFTSGRVDTYSVSNIPTVELGGTWDWGQAALPNEPRAGETLSCITPFSQLPLDCCPSPCGRFLQSGTVFQTSKSGTGSAILILS